MIFLFRRIPFFILASLLFSYFNQDSRMIGFSGAYNTVAEGYRCVGINPANLIYNDNLMISLFNTNINMNNNFLTINRLNNINGSDLENPSASNYFSKDKILNYLNGENIHYTFNSSFPLPMVNVSQDNIAYTSKISLFSNYDISPDIFRLVLYGNEIDKKYDLSMFQNTMVVSEIAFSKAYDLDFFTFGFSAKYHHGLAYYFLEPISDSSYFETAITDVSAKAAYLLKQNIKGNGYSIDLGVSTDISGWRIGASIINIGGKVLWNKEMFLDQYFKDLYASYPLRNNEHYYIDLSIENLNINTLNNPNVSINDILVFNGNNVVELDDSPGDGFILDEDYFISISEGDTIFYVVSENFDDEDLNQIEVKTIKTDLPTKMNFGLSKKIDDNKLIIFDLSTGLDNSFGNNEKWRASIGYEFGKIEMPFRLGLSYGGYDHQSLGMGISFYGKAISFDVGISYKNSLKMQSSNGIDIGFDLFWLKR